jgi:hypothetical protein
MSAYYIPMENQYSGGTVPIPSAYTKWSIGLYLSDLGPNFYYSDPDYTQRAKANFLYDASGICEQGSGKLDNELYISCVTHVDWDGIASESRQKQREPRESFIGFEWKLDRELIPYGTVARCNNATAILSENDKLYIPELQSYLKGNGGNGILKVTDTGGDLCSSPETLDLFVGEGYAGHTAYLEFMNRTGIDFPQYVSVYKQ